MSCTAHVPAADAATPDARALSLLESALGALHIHQDPAEHQQGILDAARAVVPVRSLVWVPHDPTAPIVARGEPGLTPLEYRQLSDFLAVHPDAHSGAPYLCNHAAHATWGARFPAIANLLALPATDQNRLGWILALNRHELCGAHAGQTVPFDEEDIRLLSPFVRLLELHLRSFNRYQDLKALLVGLTRSLTSALDAKNAYTYGHSERVARIAVELGRTMGLSRDELSDLYLIGLLHDVGNLGLRDAVLTKTEPLTAEEFEHIKQHVSLGFSILSDLHPLRHLLPGILYHHESYDGTGYPDGLAGEAIPLVARILALAEACDAVSNKRPYRNALSYRQVEETLVEGSGKQWDPLVVDAFLKCRHKIHTVRQRGVGASLHSAFDRVLHGEAAAPPARPKPVPDSHLNGAGS